MTVPGCGEFTRFDGTRIIVFFDALAAITEHKEQMPGDEPATSLVFRSGAVEHVKEPYDAVLKFVEARVSR